LTKLRCCSIYPCLHTTAYSIRAENMTTLLRTFCDAEEQPCANSN
jgi:hypothetical protein